MKIFCFSKFSIHKFGRVALTSLIWVIGYVASGAAVSSYSAAREKEQNEDWYGAVELYQEAVQDNPSYGDAWMGLARCTYEIGEHELTEQYLDTAEKYAKGRSDILNLRGMNDISLGKLDDARKLFTSVLASFPNDIDARFGLAELDLFDGKVTSAQNRYLDALNRQTTNRKALLSLAIVSQSLGKSDVAQQYMNLALQYHPNDAGVQYLAAYLAAKNSDFTEAERRCRAAVQINSTYDKAYELLGYVLYMEKKYEDAITVCDYRIGRNRNTPSAWYLKGLSQEKLNNDSDAIDAFTTGTQISPDDGIMRAALELLVQTYVPVEDSRRANWAQYHISQARDYMRQFNGPLARYEYQRALQIDPLNKTARTAYADTLKKDGFYELYLQQLKFMSQSQTSTADDTATKTSDTIEALDSMLKNSLPVKWNVQPFYLDKTRWKIGVYYQSSPVQLLHADAERVTASMASDIFSGVAITSVETDTEPVSGYGEAYRTARNSGKDYFILVSIAEDDRSFSLNAIVYSARTGTETTRFSVYRTGPERYASGLLKFRQMILDILPVRGKILDRSGNTLLVDIGRSEGIVPGSSFDIVKKGAVYTADKGKGVVYRPADVLGTVNINKVGEEISEGLFVKNSFYDQVATGDEVVLVSLVPPQNTSSDTSGTKKVTVTATTQTTTNTTSTAVPRDINGSQVTINTNSALLQDTVPAANVKGTKVTGGTGDVVTAKGKTLLPDVSVRNQETPLINLIQSIR